MRKFIGSKKLLESSIDVSEEYQRLVKGHLLSADILYRNGQYNEAIYFYIQAMEKMVDEKICKIIDITNPYFADRMRDTSHNLDKSIEFLIEILSGNDKVLYEQLRYQIIEGILKEIKFFRLHNDVRYPKYNSYKKVFESLCITKSECEEIAEMQRKLDIYLNDLEKIK